MRVLGAVLGAGHDELRETRKALNHLVLNLALISALLGRAQLSTLKQEGILYVLNDLLLIG